MPSLNVRRAIGAALSATLLVSASGAAFAPETPIDAAIAPPTLEAGVATLRASSMLPAAESAAVLELAANLGSFEDNYVHPTINVTELDPECALKNLVYGNPLKSENITTILNNSFGMVGINSTVIVKKII